jgi:hypothetical protein
LLINSSHFDPSKRNQGKLNRELGKMMEEKLPKILSSIKEMVRLFLKKKSESAHS